MSVRRAAVGARCRPDAVTFWLSMTLRSLSTPTALRWWALGPTSKRSALATLCSSSDVQALRVSTAAPATSRTAGSGGWSIFPGTFDLPNLLGPVA